MINSFQDASVYFLNLYIRMNEKIYISLQRDIYRYLYHLAQGKILMLSKRRERQSQFFVVIF